MIRACAVCGGSLEGKRRDAKYCGKPCAIAANSAARRASGGWISNYAHDRVCARCGIAFRGKVAQKVCSKKCGDDSRITHGRRRRDRAPKSKVRMRAERRMARAARGSSGGATVWVQGPCAVCDDPFMSRGAASRYCSERCRKFARWNRSDWIDAKQRVAIHRRDGWTCQLCMRPVDRFAGHFDDLYPSLDHIVPRSRGGSNDPSNLQTAHRLCNSIRRDQPVDVAIALIRDSWMGRLGERTV